MNEYKPIISNNIVKNELINNYNCIDIAYKTNTFDELFNDIKNKIDNETIISINYVLFLIYLLKVSEINNKYINIISKHKDYIRICYNIIYYDYFIDIEHEKKYEVNYLNFIKNINLDKEQINNIVSHVYSEKYHNRDNFFKYYNKKLYPHIFLECITSCKDYIVAERFINLLKINNHSDLIIKKFIDKMEDESLIYSFILKLFDNKLIDDIDDFFIFIIDYTTILYKKELNNILNLFVDNYADFEFLKDNYFYYDDVLKYSDIYNYMNNIKRKKKLNILLQ